MSLRRRLADQGMDFEEIEEYLGAAAEQRRDELIDHLLTEGNHHECSSETRIKNVAARLRRDGPAAGP
jgi:hypothetical protein